MYFCNTLILNDIFLSCFTINQWVTNFCPVLRFILLGLFYTEWPNFSDLGRARKVVIRCFKNQIQTKVWTPKSLLS